MWPTAAVPVIPPAAAPAVAPRRRARRGPRGRDVDAVVDAAIGLADDDGLDAVTMRRVAGSSAPHR